MKRFDLCSKRETLEEAGDFLGLLMIETRELDTVLARHSSWLEKKLLHVIK